MDWATDVLRIKTKLLGFDVNDLATHLDLSPLDAADIWAVRMLPTSRQVAAWALWIGEDPFEFAPLLAFRDAGATSSS